MSDLLSEAAAMATAAGYVAAVGVPVGFVCWLLARGPVVPRYRKGFARWEGVDAVVLFAACTLLPPLVAAGLDAAGAFRAVFGDGPRPGPDAAAAVRFDYQNKRNAVAGLLLLPGVATAFAMARRLGDRERAAARPMAADVAAGVLAWLVLTPLTLTVHFAVNAVSRQLDVVPDEHPLKQATLHTPLDVALFLGGACVVAPFFEEMAFRRVLVPWAARRLYRSWVLMALAAATACTRGHSLVGPLAFVGIAAAGLFALDRLGRRPAAAILATGTLFAAIHASVWPTPVPLLVLGVGLGWLVLRTKTVTAAVVAHGLFNAVSAVFLLRG